MTAKTCLAIYWQALRLFLKRTPIFSIRPPTAPFVQHRYTKDHRHEIL